MDIAESPPSFYTVSILVFTQENASILVRKTVDIEKRAFYHHFVFSGFCPARNSGRVFLPRDKYFRLTRSRMGVYLLLSLHFELLYL